MATKKDHLSPRNAFILVFFIAGMVVATFFFTKYMLTRSDAAIKRTPSRTGELYKYSVQDAREQRAWERFREENCKGPVADQPAGC